MPPAPAQFRESPVEPSSPTEQGVPLVMPSATTEHVAASTTPLMPAETEPSSAVLPSSLAAEVIPTQPTPVSEPGESPTKPPEPIEPVAVSAVPPSSIIPEGIPTQPAFVSEPEEPPSQTTRANRSRSRFPLYRLRSWKEEAVSLQPTPISEPEVSASRPAVPVETEVVSAVPPATMEAETVSTQPAPVSEPDVSARQPAVPVEPEVVSAMPPAIVEEEAVSPQPTPSRRTRSVRHPTAHPCRAGGGFHRADCDHRTGGDFHPTGSCQRTDRVACRGAIRPRTTNAFPRSSHARRTEDALCKTGFVQRIG